MTRDEFKAQMRRLSGLRFVPASFEGHFEVLSKLPLPVLHAAVGRAVSSRVEFPTPAELLQDADQVKHLAAPTLPEPDRTTELAEPVQFEVPNYGSITVTGEHRYHCDTCSDTGMSSHWCGGDNSRYPWLDLYRCERYNAHAEHDWSRRCTCWETNPVLVRKRERQQQYAVKPGKAA